MYKLNSRKATLDDLEQIVQLLADDDLGMHREKIGSKFFQRYKEAFARIDKDPNQCEQNL